MEEYTNPDEVNRQVEAETRHVATLAIEHAVRQRIYRAQLREEAPASFIETVEKAQAHADGAVAHIGLSPEDRAQIELAHARALLEGFEIEHAKHVAMLALKEAAGLADGERIGEETNGPEAVKPKQHRELIMRAERGVEEARKIIEERTQSE